MENKVMEEQYSLLYMKNDKPQFIIESNNKYYYTLFLNRCTVYYSEAVAIQKATEINLQNNLEIKVISLNTYWKSRYIINANEDHVNIYLDEYNKVLAKQHILDYTDIEINILKSNYDYVLKLYNNIKENLKNIPNEHKDNYMCKYYRELNNIILINLNANLLRNTDNLYVTGILNIIKQFNEL